MLEELDDWGEGGGLLGGRGRSWDGDWDVVEGGVGGWDGESLCEVEVVAEDGGVGGVG